ncbi:MAG: tRNA epoxyqueuosine(34) reductase QueG [Alphaproteobacteria bacterium]
MARTSPAGAPPDPKQRIKDYAAGLGFDAIGVAAARLDPEQALGLARFLDQGLHGTMDWLARRAEQRADPRALWPAARSVVVVAANYGPAGDPLAVVRQPGVGVISVYARGRDYHDVLKARLKTLGNWIADGFAAEVKVFVDTAPVMEKPLAEAAGVGWQGKHTNLVSRQFGSWLFLGALFTTLELEPDEPEVDHCGTCRACLDVCPTGAFLGPRRIDARRCISYLTIEHKGPIAAELRPLMGNRIYGCDDCLAICPWNKYAQPTAEAAFHARPGLDAPALAELAGLDDRAFRARFAGSPIKRTGRDRFVRNVLIAIGNGADATLAAVVEHRLDDPSPLVRGMAVWALARVVPAARFAALARHHADAETDPDVRTEWAAGAAHVPSSQVAVRK